MTEQEKKNVIALREEKIKDIESLRSQGIDPFGRRFDGKKQIKEVIEEFKNIATGEPSDKQIVIAGRIKALRKHGKAAFADLEDQTGKLQVYVKSNLIGSDSFDITVTDAIRDYPRNNIRKMLENKEYLDYGHYMKHRGEFA